MHRWAEHADKAAIMKLWAIDFESYEPYYSWYFTQVYRPELTLCDFEGNTLAAALQLAPYKLSLAGEALPVYYVVGVITDPAFRKQGRGSALLLAAHKQMQQQGYAAALLYTDIPEFYKPLGYRHYYEQQTLNLPIGRCTLRSAGGLNIDEGLTENAKPFVQVHTEDLLNHIAGLAEIYAAMTERYDGYIIREERNWRIFLGEQACDKARLLLLPGRAYVLYTQSATKLHIIELGFSDISAAYNALSAAVQAAQTAGIPQLLWHGPVDAPAIFTHIPAEFWQPRPFVMVRPNTDIAPQTGLWQGDSRLRPLWINEYT